MPFEKVCSQMPDVAAAHHLLPHFTRYTHKNDSLPPSLPFIVREQLFTGSDGSQRANRLLTAETHTNSTFGSRHAPRELLSRTKGEAHPLDPSSQTDAPSRLRSSRCTWLQLRDGRELLLR